MLITGATGFVGRNLLDLLVKTESYRSGSLKLTCVTRDASKLYSQWPTEKSRLKVLDWDIRKPLTERQPHFDYVFHLAGENRTVQDSHQAKVIFDTSVLGTQNLLRATATEKINAPKIIVASSGAVYETNQDEKRRYREPSEISENLLKVTIHIAPANPEQSQFADRLLTNQLLKSSLLACSPLSAHTYP